jgi:hypothetical protein
MGVAKKKGNRAGRCDLVEIPANLDRRLGLHGRRLTHIAEEIRHIMMDAAVAAHSDAPIWANNLSLAERMCRTTGITLDGTFSRPHVNEGST